MNDTSCHPSRWFMQMPLSCNAVIRVTRGQQQHVAFQSALYIYTSRLLSLLFRLSLSLSVLIHWKLCLREIVTLWVKLSGVRLREGRVRKWRARERVRKIGDGVALLKDMVETVCLRSGPDGSGSFDLVWTGFSIHPIPSPLSLSLSNMCGCGMLFHTISTIQALLTPPQGQMHTIWHLLYSILPISPNTPSLASLIDHVYMHIIFVIIHILVKPLFQKKRFTCSTAIGTSL